MRSKRFRQWIHEDYDIADAVSISADFSQSGALDRVVLSTTSVAAAGSGGRYFFPDGEETLFLRLLSINEDDEQEIAGIAKEVGLLKARDAKWYATNINTSYLQTPGHEKELASQTTDTTTETISNAAGQNGPLSWAHVGEPLSFWTQEIVTLREAWSLWMACQTGDAAFLTERIVWPDDWVYGGVDQVVYLDGSRGQAAEMVRLGNPTDFYHRDLAGPALLAVRMLVDRHLGSEVEVEFALDEATQRFEIVLAPRDLLTVIWIQLADAIEKRHRYRRCQECGKWFRALSQGGSRRDYCSDACRVRAYRKRKKERLG